MPCPHITQPVPAPYRLRNQLTKPMKPTFRAGALILFGLFISRPVDAQKAYAIAIGGGAAIPVGRLSETQKTGYNATAGVVIGAADLPFGLRVDGIFNRLPRHTTA